MSRIPPGMIHAPASRATPGVRVELDELIALSALAQRSGLARSRRTPTARAGGLRSRWRGRGVDFRESRVYQPGDEVRHMDWRVTARTDRPHTKLFEEEREQAVLFAFDLNPSMRFGTRARFKSVQAARAAALLAWTAAAAGDRVGALGFGGGIDAEVKPAGGRHGVLHVLRALRDWDAAVDAARSSPWSAAIPRLRRVLKPGVRLVILSDGFSADAAGLDALSQIAARHDLAVVLLSDPLERAPPPPRRYAIRFGGAPRLADFSDAAFRAAWSERFAAPRARLREACQGLGVRVIDLSTDADLRVSLAPLLAGQRAKASA